MQTIAKNRIAKFLPRITNVRSYTLANGFAGETIENPTRALEFAVNTGATFRWNKATGAGICRHHSNHWLEFTVTA